MRNTERRQVSGSKGNARAGLARRLRVLSVPGLVRGRVRFSFLILHFTFYILFATATASAQPPSPSQPASAPGEEIIAADVRLLAAHGVADNEESLVRFLTEGFPASKDLSAEPKDPPSRARLVIGAMAVAAVRGYHDTSAALVWLAQGNYGPGIFRIMDYDARILNPLDPGGGLSEIAATVRFNAIHALGLMGESSELPFLTRAFKDEKNAVQRVHIALALASAGSPEPLAFLVKQTQAKDRQVAAAATDALRVISGEDFRLTPNSSYTRRQAVVEAVAKWWKARADSFKPVPEAIRSRRLQPAVARLPLPPRSLDELIILAADEDNVAGEYSNLYAFRRIVDMGDRGLARLKEIMADEMQDINIRIFALRACEAIVKQGQGSPTPDLLDTLKKVSKANDPEVAETAARLLSDMKAILKNRAAGS